VNLARIGAFVGALAAAAPAAAQPLVLAMPRPDPNSRGWVNSPVRIEFICARADSCTENFVVLTEGAGQEFVGTAGTRDGATRTTAVTLNIDYTPPAVRLETPRGSVLTPATSIDVVAHVADALSGLASATCNGAPTPVDKGGMVRCRVALEPGVNDIVIEASDVAGNSASAGATVRRIGRATALTIIPEAASVLVGSSRTFQALSNYDMNVGPVTWSVDTPSVGTMIGNLFQAHEQGTVTVTARFADLTATATVSTYEGDRLPPDSTRWKVGGLMVMQTGAGRPGALSDKSMISTNQRPGEKTSVLSINEGSGELNWQTTIAMDPSESASGLGIQRPGGAVTVSEGPDGRSALVRTAGAAPGFPWRYQSSGTIRPELLLDPLGNVVAVETAHGSPKLLVVDGASGAVKTRDPLPLGTSVVLNAACVPGAHAARSVPAQVGPLTAQPGDIITLPMVITDDLEDFAHCGTIAGRRERAVSIATVSGAVKRIDALKRYEVGTTGTPPAIELFPVSPDGLGGWLVPWTTRFADGSNESRVAHVTGSGHQEISVAAAGTIWLVGSDNMAAMTDGRTLVVFNIVTGAAERTEVFPDGVKILGVQQHLLLLVTGKEQRQLSLQRPRG
jgi:hypothetical protein